MGAQKIAEAGVRVDGYVRVIVEVLLERESVIRLENVERAVRPKLTAELLENGCEVLLSQMLEEVTGKHETDGGIGQETKIGYTANHRRDTWRDIFGQSGKAIHGGPASALNTINKISIPGTQFQHVIVGPD